MLFSTLSSDPALAFEDKISIDKQKQPSYTLP
jgi:hypothetical protein